ncbi:SNF2-related protein [Micromonosporaceae bacterium DT194]|uniref:SNF2-related protein n=1 Tax=Melissospora conviva TaxID=3388432 RepID=UPI003C1643DF
MLVIHAVWLAGDEPALWAEDSALPVAASRRRTRSPRLHPGAASHDALVSALGPGAAEATAVTLDLLLPTRAGAPLDSPELVRDTVAEASRAAITLADWQAPALRFDADAAYVLLRALDDLGVTAGAGLRHLTAVAEFAADLVGRGRLLPAVHPEPYGGRALWCPLLTGADAQWARALALALPPAVRAAAPEREAGPLGAALLDTLVDAAARAALAGIDLAAEPLAGTATTGWLRALTGEQRTFTADAAEVTALAAGLAQWQRDAAGAAVRGCFRLVEPPEPPAEEPGWRVEFALQPADEPGVVVDAAEIWAGAGVPAALGDRVGDAQETLLAELGRASRLWPELDAALRTATPHRLELDTAGAHHFLRDGAPALHAAGFGVLLPGWWRRPASRLGTRVRATSRSAPGVVAAASAVGQAQLLDYRWELALGDETLSAEELAHLAELKSPLVRLRGQWVELDATRLAAGLRLLNQPGQMTVTELLRLALAESDDAQTLPVLEVSADGALGDLLAGRAEQHLTPRAAPPEFAGTLRPYQQRGLAWLSFLESLGLGGVLADDMGLGKTVQLLALLAGDPPGTGPTLLVCPMSLVGNWEREAARFAPTRRVHVHHGGERTRRRRFTDAVAAADLVLTTYSTAARDAKLLRGVDWHRVVVDEAQAIKNAATRQAEAVRTLPARHRIAVTGTPVENRLADLWSIMQFANPGLLGSAATFRKRYAEPVERHGDADAAQRLRRITGPFVLRRLKTDSSIITDLPAKLEMEVLCNLTAEQAALYRAIVDDMLAKIESSSGIERRGLVLATMTKLKQVCNHPAQLLRDGSALPGRSGKLARLEEILEEVLAAGERALLFTQYAEFGQLLRAHLSAHFGREVLYLHGGVGRRERDEMVARFQAGADGAYAPGPQLFVLSLKAAGTGLNLTAANHVVHVDRWWNPAVEDQATDRAFRIGQRRQVQVRKFVCAGTVEEKVAELISGKRELAAQVVGAGEQWLTELSTDRLRELFSLDAEAVSA